MKKINWDTDAVSAKSLNFTISLSHHGEGFNGDFLSTDPNDKKLLRYDIFLNKEPTDVMKNGSSCTLLDTSLNEEEAKKIIQLALDKAEETYKQYGEDNLGTITRMLENLDWTSLK